MERDKYETRALLRHYCKRKLKAAVGAEQHVRLTEKSTVKERTAPRCLLFLIVETASGTGLAFIIFTEAINQFPGAQFWSVLFFLMLFTLGIDSQFGTLEGVVTSIVDMKLFPNLRKEYLTGALCLACCLLSMAFAHGAGSYIFLLFDMYSGNFPLLIIAFFECIGISYVYGVKRFADDIELMTGQRPGIYWLICWKYLSPLAMISILVSSFIELAVDGSHYDAWISSEGDTQPKPWPLWAVLLVLVLVLSSVLWIPGVAICRYFGFPIVEDEERAWFPVEELRDFHRIEPRPVTAAETLLFCTRADGTERCCWPGCCDTDDDE
ncbi:Sodium-dependent neutral amino acid transporter B(0)AT3 [Eumeta japonica]|uniref:Sodium-dependent neutral amino acid transporter B(0)AT3 n=1 Tax=Eumeta variegata TaxID=151549 RepID=A0A4C1T5H4_EUMVA|nr:Sodium-dependent neutral amino acid transporter B(0)AT3 [Eumeta japonica]